jgi:hypothetical protein
MKLIGYLQGFTALRAKLEEYMPVRGLVHRDLAELVRTRYQFQVFPTLNPGITPPPVMLFSGGKFSRNSESFAIHQLAMKEDGDIVLATTTEQADQVVEDLVRLLDDNFGYRLSTADKKISHLNNMVVEFDKGIEEYINILAKLANAINESRIGKPSFNIKRLTFGQGAILGEASDLLLLVETADFVIERRSGTGYEANRYFCSAPLPTAEHLRLLERIEAIARGDAD